MPDSNTISQTTRDRVLCAILDLQAAGVPSPQIGAIAEAAGVPGRTTARAMPALQAEGKIRRTGRARIDVLVPRPALTSQKPPTLPKAERVPKPARPHIHRYDVSWRFLGTDEHGIRIEQTMRCRCDAREVHRIVALPERVAEVFAL